MGKPEIRCSRCREILPEAIVVATLADTDFIPHGDHYAAWDATEANFAAGRAIGKAHRGRVLARALRSANAVGDADEQAEALNDLAAFLELPLDETEQGLTAAALNRIDAFVLETLEP